MNDKKKYHNVPAAFIDSHVHLDHIITGSPDRAVWLRQVRCIPVSWSFGAAISSAAHVKDYLRGHQEIIHRLNRKGFRCFYLAGIHPRNITSDLRPGAVRDILAPYIDDTLCLGIGEIGLETGSQHERDILDAQLALTAHIVRRGKIIGIHTPRHNKPAVTRDTLLMLGQYRSYGNSIVVDHCTVDTISAVLHQGFRAGVTLSSSKTSLAELDGIVKQNPHHINRILLNTDSGTMFFEDLYRFCNTTVFPETIKTALSHDNAHSFYGFAQLA